MSALEELFFSGARTFVLSELASDGADVVQAVAQKQATAARKSIFIDSMFKM